jgi:hypothetical protein
MSEEFIGGIPKEIFQPFQQKEIPANISDAELNKMFKEYIRDMGISKEKRVSFKKFDAKKRKNLSKCKLRLIKL